MYISSHHAGFTGFRELDADGSGRLDEEDMKLFAAQEECEYGTGDSAPAAAGLLSSAALGGDETTHRKGEIPTPKKKTELGFGRRESRHLNA